MTAIGVEPGSEAEALGLFDACSNAGRWGPDDELGTLNLIDDRKRRDAASLVRAGVTVSLAHALGPGPDQAVVHRMLASSPRVASAQDVVEIAPHGFRITHLDALGHVSHAGRVYNGRPAREVMTQAGLTFGSSFAVRGGIVTRGVLLDVAAARGVTCLGPDDVVEPDDLDAAVARVEGPVEAGDAVFVRIGLYHDDYPASPEDPTRRPGLSAACLAWLHDRDVAAYGGDCVERLPSGFPAIPMPFHAIALVSMGLCVLDNVDMEALATAANRLGRTHFMLVVAPLPVPLATGSPINPIAMF